MKIRMKEGFSTVVPKDPANPFLTRLIQHKDGFVDVPDETAHYLACSGAAEVDYDFKEDLLFIQDDDFDEAEIREMEESEPELELMTKDQLVELAKEAGVRRPRSMTKSQLIDAIEHADDDEPSFDQEESDD